MEKANFDKTQLWFLVLLRWLIGWHMLYEGLIKLSNPSWTSKGYLSSAEGWFDWFFQWLASSEGMIKLVDTINIWGLTIIGLILILGLFSRYAAVAGAILIFSYYLAHPPLFEPSSVPAEGSYLFVNKTIIESCALMVVALFPTDEIVGIMRFFSRNK